MRRLRTDLTNTDLANRPTRPSFDHGAIPHIRSQLPSLSPSDARVAALILADPIGVIELSSSELAKRARTSPSTVVRCCQKMGFDGLQHLRLALAREVREDVLHHEGISDNESDASILTKVFASAARVLDDGSSTIDTVAFEQAVAKIRGARRVLFVGVGTSAPIAQDAAYRFATIGIASDAPVDVHVQHVSARLLHPDDVCVAISHTGATRETVATVRAATEASATTIAITSFSPSPITRLADIVLVTGGRELSFRHEAMASRLAHLSLLDALYVAVAMRSQDAARAALDAATDVIRTHRFSTSRRRRGLGATEAGHQGG